MNQRRWYNPNMPQTLGIAQILLYLDAVFSTVALAQVGGLGRVILLASIAAGVFGAYGIANERKIGYQVAVLASFLPLIARIVWVVQGGGGIANNLGYILLSGNILNVLFQYALIALLLHPQSTEHQRMWFK